MKKSHSDFKVTMANKDRKTDKNFPRKDNKSNVTTNHQQEIPASNLEEVEQNRGMRCIDISIDALIELACDCILFTVVVEEQQKSVPEQKKGPMSWADITRAK